MRIRSIRTRITLWYTSLLTVTFIVLGLVAGTLVFYTLYEETDSALKSVAVALAEKTRSETGEELPPEAREMFRHFFGLSPVEPYFAWLDPEGKVRPGFHEPKGILFTPEARRNAMAGIATFETLYGAEDYPVRILTWPVVDGGKVISLVRVGISRVNLYRSAGKFILTLAILLPLALALAGGGGWFFAHRALRPVDTMIASAREIGVNRLDQRLPLSGAKDELDRLAETLNGMLSRLDAAFSEMRQFTADASHELQTPLTILRGEIEVAMRSPRTPEEYMNVLVSALEEVERLSQLVEGLLLLARSDAGVLKMDHVPVDLALLTEDVLDRMKPLGEAKSVSLRVGQIEPVEVMGDYSHLRRLLLNLVDNGIKYNRPGGRVVVSLSITGDWALLSVEDTGPGIPAEEQDKIFNRFYRSAEARSGGFGGSGLGLSIVRSIVEAHHGRMEIESSSEKGTIFRVYLPTKPGDKD